MVATRRRGDIRQCVSTLTNIDRSLESQRGHATVGQRSDRPDAGGRIVSSLSRRSVVRCWSQSGWQEVGERHVGGLSSTIVRYRHRERYRIAFEWCVVTTRQCLGRHKIRIAVDDDRFFEIVAVCGRIILVTSRRCRDIGDRGSALTGIDSTFQCQRCCRSIVEDSDRPEACGRVVGSLRNGSVIRSRRESGWQQVSKADAGRLICAIIRDVDFKDDGRALVVSRIATGQRLDGYQVGEVRDDDLFFKVVTIGRWIRLVAGCGRRDVVNCPAACDYCSFQN